MRSIEVFRVEKRETVYRATLSDDVLERAIIDAVARIADVDVTASGVRARCHISKDASGIGPVVTTARVEITVDRSDSAAGEDRRENG